MSRLLALGLSALLGVACGGSHHDTQSSARLYPRPVSLQIEVYDPVTTGVWQDLGVRIIESDNEWSLCICEARYDVLLYTDETGTVYFSGSHLAAAEVGFLEDAYGRAVLWPGEHEDEAWVTIEVGDPSLGYEYFEVWVSFEEPNAYVSVPFASLVPR